LSAISKRSTTVKIRPMMLIKSITDPAPMATDLEQKRHGFSAANPLEARALPHASERSNQCAKSISKSPGAAEGKARAAVRRSYQG